jgi:protein-S-isoprenylcysteine O-methyltransferase Ste14
MVAFVVVLDVVFLAVAFGARTLVQRRRTGDSGWRFGRPHGPAEAAARGLLVVAGVLLGVAAVVTRPPAAPVVFAVGAIVAVLSVAFVALAQLQMGASWRIGVDPAERTVLITSGLYAQVRNPIYTGMVAFAVGQALMLPGLWSATAAVAMAIGVELQVRGVEEPYLREVHDVDFERWAKHAGRFLPRLGRWGRSPRSASPRSPS